MDSTSLDDATLCIPLAGFDFSGDAFLCITFPTENDALPD
jgi:hypothetical protein